MRRLDERQHPHWAPKGVAGGLRKRVCWRLGLDMRGETLAVLAAVVGRISCVLRFQVKLSTRTHKDNVGRMSAAVRRFRLVFEGFWSLQPCRTQVLLRVRVMLLAEIHGGAPADGTVRRRLCAGAQGGHVGRSWRAGAPVPDRRSGGSLSPSLTVAPPRAEALGDCLATLARARVP